MGRALYQFLAGAGLFVQTYAVDPSTFTLWQRTRHRLRRRYFKKPMCEIVLSDIAHQLRRGSYDAILSVATPLLFLEPLPRNARKVYFCHAPLAHERYFGDRERGLVDAEERFDAGLRIEKQVLAACDHVLVAWNTYEAFIRKHVWNESNITPHPGLGWYGCDPTDFRAQPSTSPAVVHLGGLSPYWAAASSLRLIARDLAPVPVDCYSPENLSRDDLQPLRFQGYAPDAGETAAKYQFGLNCVSTDELRQSAFSSKVLLYLSVGLPVLAPSWQRFAHQLQGVLAYREPAEVPLLVQTHSEAEVWRSLSRDALHQSQNLQWHRVLAPLLPILQFEGRLPIR